MSQRTDGPLLVRMDDTTAVLTLNRPEQRNAFDGSLLRLLREVIDDLDRDDSVRAVVITGAGERAFCAGADIRHMQSMDVHRAREWGHLGHAAFGALEALRKPVIAAINGAALGGGCELTLACDFRFAAKGAVIGQPEIKLGLIPGWGGTQRLARVVGQALAKDLILTGRLMPADEALRVGLVGGVAPDPAATLELAMVYARQFASLPPLAVGFAKRAIDEGADLPLREGCALEVEYFGRAFATTDHDEGIAAFLDKRPPAFTGR
ncbi:MAG TPA: enoyl-CoA hydratase-related protein [Chloroflexota bacterium]|nr:enoyl-CoA hydratase-related protein [Chloroflexota bacterium]